MELEATEAENAAPLPDFIKDIIAVKDEEYTDKLEQWKLNTARMLGGKHVLSEVERFTWETEGLVETPDLEGYQARQKQSTYVNFMALYDEKFAGTIFAQWPEVGEGLDLGTLTQDRQDMLMEAADGVGPDARTIQQFFRHVTRFAQATGYVWVLAEEPAEPWPTMQDEKSGKRPYFVMYPPDQVPYKKFEGGTLVCIHLEYEERYVGVDPENTDAFLDETRTVHYLMTRQGYEGWGEYFREGGWWMFDDDGEILTRRHDSTQLVGDWDRTDGNIPINRVFWKRDLTGKEAWTGATQLGNLAILHMNIMCFMHNDAKISGSRKRHWLGVTLNQWQSILDANIHGGIDVPVPRDPSVAGDQKLDVIDSGETSAIESLMKFLEIVRNLVADFFLREIQSAPGASGVSKKIEILQSQAPGLADAAQNIQQDCQQAIRNLEQRWTTKEPTATLELPDEYNLKTVVERIREVFELLQLAETRSPELTAFLILNAINRNALATEGSEDLDLDLVKSELRDSAGAVDMERQKLNMIMDRQAGGMVDDPEEDPEEDPDDET